mmetsp:Transcript_29047/g.40111  ORF Transcript_29047/g.40111 Transcript_29047/m.40111 type:complete len:315 (+) Transcript_29047:4536-5480(+)
MRGSHARVTDQALRSRGGTFLVVISNADFNFGISLQNNCRSGGLLVFLPSQGEGIAEASFGAHHGLLKRRVSAWHLHKGATLCKARVVHVHAAPHFLSQVPCRVLHSVDHDVRGVLRSHSRHVHAGHSRGPHCRGEVSVPALVICGGTGVTECVAYDQAVNHEKNTTPRDGGLPISQHSDCRWSGVGWGDVLFHRVLSCGSGREAQAGAVHASLAHFLIRAPLGGRFTFGSNNHFPGHLLGRVHAVRCTVDQLVSFTLCGGLAGADITQTLHFKAESIALDSVEHGDSHVRVRIELNDGDNSSSKQSDDRSFSV